MNNKTKLTLLFTLVVILLLGTAFAVPLLTSADDNYTLTISVRDSQKQQVEMEYGSIRVNGTNYTDFEITYQGSGTVTLTASVDADKYTFMGWLDENGSTIESSASYSVTLNRKITLYAILEPKTYPVYYVGAKDVSGLKFSVDTDPHDHPEYFPLTTLKHTYGVATALPEKAYTNKAGEVQTHTFQYWTAFSVDGTALTITDGIIDKSVHTDIYLVPVWKANKFEVTCVDLVPSNYSAIPYAQNPEEDHVLQRTVKLVEYGITITAKNFETVFESLAGKEYKGYVSNGEFRQFVVGKDGYEIERSFKPINYRVRIADEESVIGGQENDEIRICVIGQRREVCNSFVQIYIDGKKLDAGSEVLYEYGTVFDLKIAVREGYNKKLVYWNEYIDHTASKNESVVAGETTRFVIWVYDTEPTPIIIVDYPNETFYGLVAGNYRVSSGEDVWEFYVDNLDNIITTDGNVEFSDLLGKTCTAVRLATRRYSTTSESGSYTIITADSDPIEFTLAARPAAPVDGSAAFHVIEDKDHRELKIEVINGVQDAVYEVAYTTKEGQTPTNWTTDLHLKNLEVGKDYTVYLRVRATSTVPHGLEYEVVKDFEFSHLTDLTPIIVILVIVFLLQAFALALLLISHNRARLNAVASPLAALLAVKLLPNDSALAWVIILTILVVAMQAALVYFAIHTGVVLKKKNKDEEPVDGEKTDATDSSEFTLFGEPAAPQQEIPVDEEPKRPTEGETENEEE